MQNFTGAVRDEPACILNEYAKPRLPMKIVGLILQTPHEVCGIPSHIL